MKLAKTVPEVSVTGLVGAYIAWSLGTGQAPLDPLWVAIAGYVAVLVADLYRAWADDGKITPDEIAQILGVGQRDLDDAVAQIKDKKLAADREQVIQLDASRQ